MNSKMLHMVAFILLVVGGVNWGLVGLLDVDLVEMVFGSWPMVVKLVYILVGLSALYEVFTHKRRCTECQAG